MIVLQDMALRELSPRLRRKTQVILQSAPPVPRQPGRRDCIEIVVSGHLRDEKDPFRGAAALAELPPDSRIRITHIGGARQPALAAEAKRWMRREPRYRWLGELPRQQALATLARATALLISSRMEGGANVVSEALTARVPVIASRIPGNVGLLGPGYAGYYSCGNTRALARLLARVERDQDFLHQLRRQCLERRPLVSRSRERNGLRTALALAVADCK